jgi:hypothetical protein
LECQNFVAARDAGLVYPDEVVQLFNKLGIDVTRECEVHCYGQVLPGRHEYGGFFNVIGRLVADENFLTEVAPGFQLYPMAQALRLMGGFPEPAFRVEFLANVPWVIDHAPAIGATGADAER